jgi:hypothetical protein
MRQAARRDANHQEIADMFRAYSFDVIDTAGYSGKMLDLLITLGDHFFCFIEIKDGRKPKSARKLTDDEKDFISKRPDHCAVIETVEQARAMAAHVIAGRHF